MPIDGRIKLHDFTGKVQSDVVQIPSSSRPTGVSKRLVLRGFGVGVCLAFAIPAFAGGPPDQAAYKVLPAIVRNNLALFPVITGRSFDTSQLLTLDEGIRSGQVTISENGDRAALVHPGQSVPPRQQEAEVNRLVLYNNSAKPLLLLAGEIVTGGKQDRVIGSDRIVPPNSGPIDLSVFCVEPGRWTGAKPTFGSLSMQMAQPDVRAPAMAEQNQGMVWDNVRNSNAKAAAQLHGAESTAAAGTSSYAKVFASPPVQRLIAGYGGEEGQQEILKELRNKAAVGVVVVINGRVVWADVFANPDLLAKYWSKLMSSYVAEAMTAGNTGTAPSLQDAETWMSHMGGNREVAETEPGVYRRTDVTGDGYRVFELVSLLPGTGFPVHLTKIGEASAGSPISEHRQGLPDIIR
jgi:hypothetical protein